MKHICPVCSSEHSDIAKEGAWWKIQFIANRRCSVCQTLWKPGVSKWVALPTIPAALVSMAISIHILSGLFLPSRQSGQSGHPDHLVISLMMVAPALLGAVFGFVGIGFFLKGLALLLGAGDKVKILERHEPPSPQVQEPGMSAGAEGDSGKSNSGWERGKAMKPWARLRFSFLCAVLGFFAGMMLPLILGMALLGPNLGAAAAEKLGVYSMLGAFFGSPVGCIVGLILASVGTRPRAEVQSAPKTGSIPKWKRRAYVRLAVIAAVVCLALVFFWAKATRKVTISSGMFLGPANMVAARDNHAYYTQDGRFKVLDFSRPLDKSLVSSVRLPLEESNNPPVSAAARITADGIDLVENHYEFNLRFPGDFQEAEETLSELPLLMERLVEEADLSPLDGEARKSLLRDAQSLRDEFARPVHRWRHEVIDTVLGWMAEPFENVGEILPSLTKIQALLKST